MTETFNMHESRGGQFDVQRHGEVVVLAIVCSDRYAAIELYDKIVAGAQNGGVCFDLQTKPEDPP